LTGSSTVGEATVRALDASLSPSPSATLALIQTAPAGTEAIVGGEVHGEVPQITSLESACEGVNLGEFLPGVEKAYVTTFGLTATSTGAETELTAEDETGKETGHLVQGSYALPQPLETKASGIAALGGTGGPFESLENPVTLLTAADAPGESRGLPAPPDDCPSFPARAAGLHRPLRLGKTAGRRPHPTAPTGVLRDTGLTLAAKSC
jgi:hypothetical protein